MNITSVTIRLVLPHAMLSPNASRGMTVGGRRWRARLVKEYRRSAYIAAIDAMGIFEEPPYWTAAHCTTAFFFPDLRHRDLDNAQASIKPAFDGIADAGLIVDDSVLTHDAPKAQLDRQNPRVELTFTRLPDPETPAPAPRKRIRALRG